MICKSTSTGWRAWLRARQVAIRAATMTTRVWLLSQRVVRIHQRQHQARCQVAAPRCKQIRHERCQSLQTRRQFARLLCGPYTCGRCSALFRSGSGVRSLRCRLAPWIGAWCRLSCLTRHGDTAITCLYVATIGGNRGTFLQCV